MTRRFQFSLRGLLGVLALACVVLGSWCIYVTHFASFVEADPAVVGKPFFARWRVFIFGSRPSAFTVEIASSGGIQAQALVDIPSDFGWGGFDFEADISPMIRPGNYDVQVRLGNDVITKGQAMVSPARPTTATKD